MKRRLFFLLPDAEVARTVFSALQAADIGAKQIRFLSRSTILPADLPQATFLQRTDFLPAMEAGGSLGAVAGAAGGAFVWIFPPAGLMPDAVVICVSAVLGGFLGAWLASVAGSSEPNSALRDFQTSMESGKVLCMVDVPYRRIEAIRDLVARHHPQAQWGGVAPHIPALQ